MTLMPSLLCALFVFSACNTEFVVGHEEAGSIDDDEHDESNTEEATFPTDAGEDDGDGDEIKDAGAPTCTAHGGMCYLPGDNPNCGSAFFSNYSCGGGLVCCPPDPGYIPTICSMNGGSCVSNEAGSNVCGATGRPKGAFTCAVDGDPNGDPNFDCCMPPTCAADCAPSACSNQGGVCTFTDGSELVDVCEAQGLQNRELDCPGAPNALPGYACCAP